jgi:hypothetical protein
MHANRWLPTSPAQINPVIAEYLAAAQTPADIGEIQQEIASLAQPASYMNGRS